MKTFKRALLLAALPALGLISTANAHRQWLLASTTILSGEDQWVSVEGAISNDLFFPNHHAIPLKRTTAFSPSGKQLELQNASEGKIRSSFELLLEEQGTYRIASVSDRMIASWQENGERQRMRGSKDDLIAKGISDKEDLKIGEYTSRVETIVTCGAPTPIETTGSGLEFAFDTHPNDIFLGETTRFQVILDGQPKSGCEVTIVKGNDRFRNSVNELIVTSDAEGYIEIDWPSTGRFWLNASEDLAPGEFLGKPTKRSSSYVLTLEVLPE